MKSDLADLDVHERKLVREIDGSEVVEYLKKLVAIPSVFGSEHRISEQIAHDLKDFGLEVTSVPVPDCGPDVVGVGSKNSFRSKPVFVFNGHMDTVQVCDGWKHDPFSPTVEGDRLYGLGSGDMKAGLTAAIMASKALVSSGVPLKRDFALHGVSDEEAWGRGTNTLIDQGFYNDTECCIVGEPSGLSRLRNARRGTRNIDVIVTGKSTHGSRPEGGINAIVEAAKVITVLSKLPNKTHPRILDFRLQPLQTSSCILKVEAGSDALRVPDKCVLRLDRHVLPGTTTFEAIEEVRSYVQQNLDKDTLSRVRVEFTPLPTGAASGYDAFETDPRSELVRTISSVSSIFGYTPPLVAGHSVADDCLIATRCKVPVVSYGPSWDMSAPGGGSHESDEYVLTKQVIDATRIYAVTAYRIINRTTN